MAKEAVIETRDLTKVYNGLVAVDHLNLKVYEGEVYGILGPNGSGKTTTILMLLGLTEPTSGTVRVVGWDPSRYPLRVKAQVGYIPDRVGFYDDMTAWENLMYTAKLNGLSRREAYRRIDEALAWVGLASVAHRPVRTFSRGMRQRLGVADVLIKQPRVIIMDEPTQGLDPESAREFLELIRTLKKQGKTILLASHLLHQVQAVCDRVGLFHKGKKALEGTVEELGRQVLGTSHYVIVEVEGEARRLLEPLRQVKYVQDVEQVDDRTLWVKSLRDVRPEVAQAVVENGGRLMRLDVELPSLDDIYTHYFQTANDRGDGNAGGS